MAGPFELALSQFAKDAGEKADQAVRRVVLDVGRRIIERSPVDTGRFRSNWFFSTGTPSSKVTEDKTSHEVKGMGDLSNAKAGQVFYISNNLPYAYRLEVRGATKARNALGELAGPSGIVGLTVLDFQAIVDKAAKEVSK
jgi:hypothetical protein